MDSDHTETSSAAHWSLRLERERTLDPAATAGPAVERLRNGFRQITQLMRQVTSSPWLSLMALRNANRRLEQTLAASRLLLDGLTHYDQPRMPVVPVPTLLVLQQEIEHDLRYLAGVLKTLSTLQRVSEDLHPLAESVTYGAEVSATRWLKTADRIVGESAGTEPLTFEAETSFASALQEAGWSRAGWYVRAISAAHTFARIGGELLDRSPRELVSVVAALLFHDLGLWRVWPVDMANLPKSQRDPLHPARGAALTAALTDLPSLVPMLIGSHHERLDGSGYPQRLSGRRLSTEAQVCGMVALWCETLLDRATTETAIERNEPLWLSAGLELWRHVERGAVAMPMASGLLEILYPGSLTQVLSEAPRRRHRAVDVGHAIPAPHTFGRSAARSPEENAAPGQPAFLRRSRHGARRTVVIPKSSATQTR